MQPPPATPAHDRLRALLRQILRVVVEDGRVFLGTFAGTDKALNVLLVNTEEYRPSPGDGYEGRFVGQVMIPWKFVKKVEVQSGGHAGQAAQADGAYM